jgi:hypothetical protein
VGQHRSQGISSRTDRHSFQEIPSTRIIIPVTHGSSPFWIKKGFNLKISTIINTFRQSPFMGTPEGQGLVSSRLATRKGIESEAGK